MHQGSRGAPEASGHQVSYVHRRLGFVRELENRGGVSHSDSSVAPHRARLPDQLQEECVDPRADHGFHRANSELSVVYSSSFTRQDTVVYVVPSKVSARQESVDQLVQNAGGTHGVCYSGDSTRQATDAAVSTVGRVVTRPVDLSVQTGCGDKRMHGSPAVLEEPE